MSETADAVGDKQNDTVSVRDHEAFTAKHMPDLGHDVKDFKVFTWKLTDWKKLEKRVTSKEFKCGGHRWRILLYPYGARPTKDTISVYLDHAGTKKAKGWHACVQLVLAFSNPQDPTIYHSTAKHTTHRFIAEEYDWGYAEFATLRELLTIQKGDRPIIEDEATDITVYVRVFEDPTGDLWRHNESKKEIDYGKGEQNAENPFLTAKFITDETFSRHEGFDLATFDEGLWQPSELPSFHVLKSETYSVFKKGVALYFDYPENQFRLWVLVNRQNRTVRPDTPIPDNEPASTVEAIRKMAAKQSDLRLYLDVIPDTSKPDIPPQSIMVFLKHFDTSKQTLHGVGKVYIPKTAKVADLVPLINERMRWPSERPLNLFEEIKPGMIEPMGLEISFSQCEIQDGDVICFQVDLSEKEVHELEARNLHSNPVHFYEFLQNRVKIIFKPKFEECNSESEFSLVLSKKHKYDLMSHRAGEYLRHDPIMLRFTTTYPTTGQPKAILKRSSNQNIAEIMDLTRSTPTTTVILYEKLDVSIVELETKQFIRVVWTGINNKEENHRFLLAKSNTVDELAYIISRVVYLLPGSKIRIFGIPKGDKTRRELIGSEMIGNIPEQVELYATGVTDEKIEVDGTEDPIGLTRELNRNALVRSLLSPVLDKMVENLRNDPDLDPHEARLLPCIADSSSLKTTFNQVHLPSQTVDAVRTIVSLPLLHPHAFQQGILKEHSMTGCLLFGPPGTGKTLVVRALAKEAGCRMLAVSPSDVMDMKYVGEGEKLVRAVFSLARKLSPCVVFLDELDALFGAMMMSARHSGGEFAQRSVITEFMQEMDGLKSSREHNVIVIGATNRPFDLDDAVLRRLPQRFLVDLPGQQEREEILKIMLCDEMLASDVNITTLAKQTEGFSGSDLKHLCVSSALYSLKESVALPLAPTNTYMTADINTELDAGRTGEQSKSTSTSTNESGMGAKASIHPPPPPSRTLYLKHFSQALKEIPPFSAGDPGSLADLRKWNEEFGEGRGDPRTRQQVWGKSRFGIVEKQEPVVVEDNEWQKID